MKKKLLILVVVVGLLGGAGWFGYRLLMGPAEGTITNAVPDTTPKQAAIQLEQFDGTYMSFAHPSTFVLRPNKGTDTSGAATLESYNFVASGLVSKLLTVTVTKLPSGNLQDDASYYMRSLHPDIYQLTPQTIGSDKVVVILNKQEYQLAAFWPHGGKLLTMAISSVQMDTGSTNQDFQQMLSSVMWK